MKRFIPKPYERTEPFVEVEKNQFHVNQLFKSNRRRRKQFCQSKAQLADEEFNKMTRPPQREKPKTRLEIPMPTGQVNWYRPDGWVAKALRDPEILTFIDPHPPRLSSSSSCPPGIGIGGGRRKGGDGSGGDIMSKTADSFRTTTSQSHATQKSEDSKLASSKGFASTQDSFFSKKGDAAQQKKSLTTSQSFCPRGVNIRFGKRQEEAEGHLKYDAVEPPQRPPIDPEEVERVRKMMVLMGSRYPIFKKNYRPRQSREKKVPLRRIWMNELELWQLMEGDAPKTWLRIRQSERAAKNGNKMLSKNAASTNNLRATF